MSIDVNVQNDLVIVTESSEDVTVNVSNAAGPQGPAGANGVGVPVGGTTGQVLKKFTNTNYDTYWAADASGLTSVGLSMPSAFAVSNSPLTSNGTIAVTGAGTADQYVRGDGQLANFPTNGGGGSAFNYYLNGSVSQGTFGGDTYYEMSKTPIIGAGTNFTRTNAQGNGYIASFITDAGDPALLNIPGGNWNIEFYFAASSGGGTPSFYNELYKVSSANVFTLIGSGSTNPEGITQGTVVDQYFTSIPVPQTALLATDRIAIRIFVTPSGRNITLHTENSNLCEVLTTFSTGLNALNGLTAQVQYFATGTSGTDFAISSATDTHTFNLPTASGTNRGALSSADWTTFNNKVSSNIYTADGTLASARTLTHGGFNLTFVGGTHTNRFTSAGRLLLGTTTESTFLLDVNGTARVSGSLTVDTNTLFVDATNDRVGIGTTNPATKLEVVGASGIQIRNGATDGFSFQQANTNSWAWTGLTAVSTYIIQNANLLVGTTVDAGFKLDVNGTARVSGDLTLNPSGISTITQNATTGNYNQILFKVNGTTQSSILALSSALYFSVNGSSTALTIASNLNVGIGTTNPTASAILDVTSTSKGFLPPRMTNAQRVAISSPAVGLMVYQTDSTEGTYEYISSGWRIINGGGGGSVDELQVALLSQVYG